MGAVLGVQVFPQSGYRERSEAQLRKGNQTREGSVAHNHGPLNKKRIRGDE